MTRRLRELPAVERTPDRPGPGPVPPTVLRSIVMRFHELSLKAARHATECG